MTTTDCNFANLKHVVYLQTDICIYAKNKGPKAIKICLEPATATMHSSHSLFLVWTNWVNQLYSHTAVVLTKETKVIRVLAIDRDQ